MRRLLSEHPKIGRVAAPSGARRLVITPYVVIYRKEGEEVEIIDIRHSRQRERPIPDATE
jgi:plasmid stabilization system protein ParE